MTTWQQERLVMNLLQRKAISSAWWHNSNWWAWDPVRGVEKGWQRTTTPPGWWVCPGLSHNLPGPSPAGGPPWALVLPNPCTGLGVEGADSQAETRPFPAIPTARQAHVARSRTAMSSSRRLISGGNLITSIAQVIQMLLMNPIDRFSYEFYERFNDYFFCQLERIRAAVNNARLKLERILQLQLLWEKGKFRDLQKENQ